MPEGVGLYEEDMHVYERVHYSHGEERDEVEALLSWFNKPGARVLDLGCGTGLHVLELAARGFRAVGLDSSQKALAVAAERARGVEGARFEHSDLEYDGLAGYGVQDLVVSLGNTVSHLSRSRLVLLFDNVRRVLAPGGVFVFNAMYWSSPFQRSVVERDPTGAINVVWERQLNEERGTVLLKGHFLKESLTKALEVQCYKVPEMVNLLSLAGFVNPRWSDSLDFRGKKLSDVNTVYYRAVMPKGGRLRRT